MDETPLKAWEAFYVIVGSSAGALTGLQFVVLTLIGESDNALTLQEASYPPALYVPVDDLDRSLLSTTDTSTYCPYKGEASYYAITTDDVTVDDAGWYYAEPYDAVAPIAHHVAFYPNLATVVVD